MKRKILCLLLFLAPALEAQPGYISLKQENGVWWFVNSDGKKFFSTGVNCVGGCFGHFEKTPIEAKRKQWIVTTLKNWNFNTAGDWSSPSVYDSLYVADQIYHGVNAWENDMYDEALWSKNVLPRLKDEVKPFLKLKTLIGYYVDNEHKWDAEAIFKFYLSLPAKSAGSKRLVDFLRRAYDADLGKMKAELGLKVSSFEEVPGAKAPDKFSNTARHHALKPWRSATAAYFYGRYVAELRRLDPDHLVLGVRWAGFPDMDLFEAVSPFMDVNSINDYNRYGNLRPVYWDAYKATGKPMIISEWSYSGYPTPGKKSLQFIDVYNQKNRGIGYRKYTHNMARAPFMVGSHWFLWGDYDHAWVEKNGGYLPDENMGLVSSDEKVTYTELGSWCRAANREIPDIHSNSSNWTPKSLPRDAPKIVAPFVAKIDGKLNEWPATLKVKMGMSEALDSSARARGDYYLGLDASGISVAASVPDASIEETGPDWSWQSDNLSLKVAAFPEIGLPEDSSSHFQIHPSGSGKGKTEPYIFSWTGNYIYQLIEASVARKSTKTGFVIEAMLDAKFIKAWPGKPGQQWKVSLMYEDIDAVSETWWEGILSLPVKP